MEHSLGLEQQQLLLMSHAGIHEESQKHGVRRSWRYDSSNN
jgi:hypothetical protein